MNKMIESILQQPVYGVCKADKEALLMPILNALVSYHRSHCAAYDSILEAQSSKIASKFLDIPFLPVRLFKQYNLASVGDDQIFKVLTSSGTTGQAVSRIPLDRQTSGYQTTALIKIMQDFLGKSRLPMLIVDHPSVIQNRLHFSARGAGIRGLSNFGRNHTYILNDEKMELDTQGVSLFLEKFVGQQILLFGFTYIVWQFLIQALEYRGMRLEIPEGVLIHSGGWKKLEDKAVGHREFKRRLLATTNIQRSHNFYGMVEQVGSIFVECEFEQFHVPTFAQIIIRDPATWAELSTGEEGLIQVISCLPLSYPGHSLLTEDLGTITGEDNCPCGRLGKTFRVHGRLSLAEVRGCSDTFVS
jgi:hypothetical protein